MYSFKYFTYLLMLCSFLSCGEAAQAPAESVKPTAENGTQYSDATGQALQHIMHAYYSVKDALVASDSLKAKESAAVLAAAVDTLQWHADTASKLSALSYPGMIKEAAMKLQNTSRLEAQRAVFETISNHLYEMVKVLKPAGVETYKQYCPMAFDDKGAYWLSDTSHIQNPYFGKKMLICGEVQEALRYK